MQPSESQTQKAELTGTMLAVGAAHDDDIVVIKPNAPKSRGANHIVVRVFKAG